MPEGWIRGWKRRIDVGRFSISAALVERSAQSPTLLHKTPAVAPAMLQPPKNPENCMPSRNRYVLRRNFEGCSSGPRV